jgi:wyosine [tRNA(Phe)-imidazoG37] synthetase (radical SAM superfamily)
VKTIFGPVPSRRLGQSLGIDTIPLKTCNWNCVYCQLGRTVPLTHTRQEYIPAEEILAEAEQVLRSRANAGIDWVTFVGSGEPTLHNRLGWLIRQIKSLTDRPVAVITNGSLLYLPEVRQELLAADAVLPSLDAGSVSLYRKINRPHPESTFERLVDGLISFRRDYPGMLWVEVMLIQALNDSEQALKEIARILQRVKPDSVQINLPTRPPAETWVQPPDQDGLERAEAILGKNAALVQPAGGSFDLSGYENLTDSIIAVITRHPMSQDELVRTLKHHSLQKVEQALADLKGSGRVQVVERLGKQFWSAHPAIYPDELGSQRPMPTKKEEKFDAR